MDRKTLKPTRRTDKEAALPAKFAPRFWEHCDMRLAVIRSIRSRYKTLYEACGGWESPQRDEIIQHLAFLSVMIETAEVTAAEEGRFDAGSYVQSLNALMGILKALGLDRRTKNVTDLNRYLAEKQRRAG